MKKALLDILYKQILLFSEKGKSNIGSPNILIQETHKCSGKPRKEVIKLFRDLIDIGFVEKVPNEKYAYRVKNMMSIEEIKRRKPNMLPAVCSRTERVSKKLKIKNFIKNFLKRF